MQRIEREKKNAKKYRGIRFIEGQKLTRKLKKLQKSLETADAKVGPGVLLSRRRPPFPLIIHRDSMTLTQ